MRCFSWKIGQKQQLNYRSRFCFIHQATVIVEQQFSRHEHRIIVRVFDYVDDDLFTSHSYGVRTEWRISHNNDWILIKISVFFCSSSKSLIILSPVAYCVININRRAHRHNTHIRTHKHAPDHQKKVEKKPIDVSIFVDAAFLPNQSNYFSKSL